MTRSWGATNHEVTAEAEAEWLRLKGEWGEQPAEPPCRCPRPCWCQGEDAS